LQQFKEFQSHFPETDASTTNTRFSMTLLKFQKKLPGLREKFCKWNVRKSHEKVKYLETFSLKNWQCLSQAKKKEHSLANCKGCVVRYSDIQALFPVKSAVLKGKAKDNPIFTAEDEAQTLNKSFTQVKPLQRDIINAAKTIYNKVESVFEKKFSTSFAEALSKVPELNLQNKSPNERRQERRNYYRKAKENVEKQMEKTAFLR
jgi:hypothetical protein